MKDIVNTEDFNPNRKVTFAIDRRRLLLEARRDDIIHSELLGWIVDALMGDKEAEEFVPGLAEHGIAVLEKTH